MEADGLLLGEVRHATGNLLHRMRYWTSLLEAESLGGNAGEAVSELRSSLDGLQQLIATTMELLRPATRRPMAIPPSDLVDAVAVRFGLPSGFGSTAAGAPTDFGAVQAFVDPAMLDRALTVLAEAFEPGRRDEGIGAEIVATAPDGPAVLNIRMAATPRSSSPSDPYGVVRHDVNVALATKLLRESGCASRIVQGEGTVDVILSFPVAAAR